MIDDLETRASRLSEDWQDYCLPDRTQLLQPKINALVAEIDDLLQAQGTPLPTQATARRTKPNSSTSRAKSLTCSQLTKSPPKSC